MQMTGTPTTTPGNKSPPPPMVQQSVGSAGHSRNVSQGSSKSQTATVVQAVAAAATVQSTVEEVETRPLTGESAVPLAAAASSSGAPPVQAEESPLPKDVEVKQEETPKTP